MKVLIIFWKSSVERISLPNTSVDIVGPLPTDRRVEYNITFLDCYSKYAILIFSKDHMAQTDSSALLERVIPYFGVPWQLLSDRGRAFTGQVWDELLRTFGIQRVITSPYHPEGNIINECSHRTMNNMLWAYLYTDGNRIPKWVNKIPAIMLTFNSMPHQQHGYATSMVAMGRETMLPPDLVMDANSAGTKEDPSAHVSGIQERLREVYRRVTPTAAPARPNPDEPGNLIWVATLPLERTSKLFSKWTEPYQVVKVPNLYQVAFATGAGTRTVHIHQTKPALLNLLSQELRGEDDPLAALPLGYFPTSFTHRPVARNQARGPPESPPLSLTNPFPLPEGLATGTLVGPGSSNQSAVRSIWISAALDPTAELGSEPTPGSSAQLTPCRPMKMQQLKAR